MTLIRASSGAQVKVIEGNHAASYAVMLARAEVVAAYPITPQTTIVEKLAEAVAAGQFAARFLNVESEHSAMASCIGASAAGARAFTATSSQGLALMHELLHYAAGMRLPLVMVNCNRALAAPWNLNVDQGDSLAQRDTGWLQFYCESNQEVLDSVLMAYRIAERVLLPAMVNLDAFVLTHTSEPVEIPAQAAVDAFLPPYRPEFRLDVAAAPHTFGSLAGPHLFTELRYRQQQGMEEAKREVERVGIEFGRHFGRGYGLVEEYHTEGAEALLVTSGTITSTARLVVDEYRQRGVPLGLLKMRTFRPFPAEEVRRVAGDARKLAVVDRNVSLGAGGIFCQETKMALYNLPRRPAVFGFIAGLGGRDVTPATITEIVETTLAADWPAEESIWIGVKR